MHMFRSFLDSMPKNRSDFVEDLDLPELPVEPYVWSDPVESLVGSEDSLLTGSIRDCEPRSIISSDSSLTMSCAMPEAEVDYKRYRLHKTRSFSDPWDYMRAALDDFPPSYLDSVNSSQTISTEATDDTASLERKCLRNEELLQKMERFFDEECRVFTPDDPGLLTLEEALLNVDYKNLESDSENSKSWTPALSYYFKS